ncbi:MAG TPA: hypothetical protein VF885_18085 [Arthrobacter sp.]
MQSITWFTPILPGKLEEWQAMVAEVNGPRREEIDRLYQSAGVAREVASLMHTPQGDFVCLFHESEDLAKAFQTLAASDDPYDAWFKEHLVSVHGLTAEMLAGPIPAKLFFDYRDAG